MKPERTTVLCAKVLGGGSYCRRTFGHDGHCSPYDETNDYPQTVVTVTVASREDDGAMYTLVYPNGKRVTLGDAEDNYHHLAAIIDGEHDKVREPINPPTGDGSMNEPFSPLTLVRLEKDERRHLYYGLGGCTANGGVNSTDQISEVNCIQCLAKFDLGIDEQMDAEAES